MLLQTFIKIEQETTFINTTCRLGVLKIKREEYWRVFYKTKQQKSCEVISLVVKFFFLVVLHTLALLFRLSSFFFPGSSPSTMFHCHVQRNIWGNALLYPLLPIHKTDSPHSQLWIRQFSCTVVSVWNAYRCHPQIGVFFQEWLFTDGHAPSHFSHKVHVYVLVSAISPEVFILNSTRKQILYSFSSIARYLRRITSVNSMNL